MNHDSTSLDWNHLAACIKSWGKELGFDAIGITDTDLKSAESGLSDWLAAGFHGEMDYMARHGSARARPAELIPGTLRVITARMNYLATGIAPRLTLEQPEQAYIARYALGRDYHKVMRSKLADLARRIEQETGGGAYRVFTDSAPVMEVELSRKSGLGWRGKHTLLLSREAGSWFFLGEIYTDLPLPIDPPGRAHCGSCTACIDACPTKAIVAPYQLDARRCISYLTIELRGSIPLEFRPLIGNRVYGCDDCQIFCPWNRYAQSSTEPDFQVRSGLDRATLLDLFAWSETDFQQRLAGSAIYRIGHERWLRNLAVGLGNAPSSEAVIQALRLRLNHPSELVREHVEWALDRQARGGLVRRNR